MVSQPTAGSSHADPQRCGVLIHLGKPGFQRRQRSTSVSMSRYCGNCFMFAPCPSNLSTVRNSALNCFECRSAVERVAYCNERVNCVKLPRLRRARRCFISPPLPRRRRCRAGSLKPIRKPRQSCEETCSPPLWLKFMENQAQNVRENHHKLLLNNSLGNLIKPAFRLIIQ